MEPEHDARRRPKRKVEILQAVIDLLEDPRRKVTTAALAKQVGFSEAALYRHFSSKEAMFRELAEYLEGHLLRPANQLLSSNESPLMQLRRIFEYHLRFFSEHPGLCRVFLVEGLWLESEEIPDRMIALVRKYLTQIKQLLRRSQAAGEIPADIQVEEGAQLLVGIVQTRVWRFVMSRYTDSPAKHWEEAWILFCRAISATQTTENPDSCQGC